MRKIYAALLSFFLFFTLNSKLNAQAVGTYVFSPSSGTYTALVGATVAGTATGDDGLQNVALGFNFVFGGVSYTNATISTNGAIKLSNSAVADFATSWTNNLSNTYGAPIIGPLWDDNNATGGSVVYLATGTAPNRTFSVEWINIHMGGVGSTTTPTGTFQLTLTEGSNTVQFVYGTINAPTASSIGIGLNDLTSFLSVTPGSPATASNSVANNNITSNTGLTSGTTYLFFPPPPCVAPPAGGTTASSVANPCPGGSFILSVTGASFGTGLTYQWESSPNNTAWTPIGGATGATYTTSITTTTYFRRKITCSGIDGYSTSFLATVAPLLTLPVTEGFNTSGTNVFPGCWAQQYVIGTGNLLFQTSSTNPNTIPFEGTRYVYWNSFNIGSGNETRLVSPGIVTTGTSSVDVKFYWYNENSPFYTTLLEGVQVQYSLNGTTWVDAGAFVPRQDISLASGTGQWKLKKITLPAAAGNQPAIWVGFKFHSVFGDNCSMDAATIEATPPCVEPTNLSVTAATPTSATLSWTASPSSPTNGYQWEVRTSGAAGSGATGLAASGATAAGVTTANATGLTANTAYSYYVRSDCGGIFSGWTLAFAFTTPCNPITTPFTETFSTYTTTFPPTCWTRNNTTYLTGQPNSAYGNGAGSVMYDFYSAASGTQLDMVSPLFTPVPAGYRVAFDHAYATFAGENDQLQILYSTNGGATYTPLITYAGGTAGPLNTGGANFAPFAPTATQWIDKWVALPVGTNRLIFRGISAFGNNLFLDNITVEQTPSCLPVSGVTAIGISPTSAIVSFTSPAPGTSFIIEYGPPGFTPGTTNAAGGGTVVFTNLTSYPVTGLTPNTPYDFNVRQICIPGVDYSANKKASASTLCNAVNIPYLQNFESATVPAMPTCTSVQDVNGNSGSFWLSGAGGLWETYQSTTQPTYVSPNKSLLYSYDPGNLARGGDDWFYIQGLNLNAGQSYRLKFFYKGVLGPTYFERLEVKYGTTAHSSGMTSGTLYTNNNILSALADNFDSVIVDFTPPANGVYYIGFHSISLGDQGYLILDDISVKTTPLVDVGITGIVTPSLNCPTNGVFVQATIKNYNTTTLNFAQYPVTVTANITGAGTGTLSTVLNTGTLAAGAEMGIYLSPAFNFSAGGTYNITVATSSPDDPETGNNTFTTAINVNPNPTTPVITPAVSNICLGSTVQLNTQFTAAPPPVTMPAVTSGTISVAVPDGSPVGVTHTLNVTGVPAGATITGVSVNINLTHTWISDMVINLKAPNGNNILNLFNARGGAGDNLTNMTISSTGTNSLATGAAPFTGTWAPDAAIGVGPTAFTSNVGSFGALYAGNSGNGAWTLAMRDLVGFDLGTLTSWSITITYQLVNPIVTWTPVTGLYTNAGATTAYASGTDAYSVYAKPATAGSFTYTATATTAAGCTASGTAVVNVNPLPTVTIGTIPDTVCISDQVIPLVANPVGGTWTGIGVSGTNFIPPATAVGTYTLTYSYTSTAGCTVTRTKNIAVKDCPERYILLRDNAVILYPNPNQGQFNIRINSVLYNNLGMKVYTNSGVLVRTQQFGNLTWGRVVPIDLTNLPGGVYMVKFYYEGGARTSEKAFKVIIGH